MSVKAVMRRGKPVWRVQVLRDGGKFNRRRFLDRRTHLKRDALEVEVELLAEYEAFKQGGGTTKHKEETSTPTSIIEYPAEVAPAVAPPAIAPAEAMLATSRSSTAKVIPGFGEFAEQYLAIQDSSRPDFKNKVRNVRMHLVPFFGTTPLDQVSRMMIDMFKVRLRTPTGERATSRRTRNRKEAPVSRRRKGGARSPRTINNLLTTLRSILNLAYDYELLDRVPRIKMEPVKKRDAGFLTDEETEAFLAAAPEEWRPFLQTAVRTGMRRGELLELRWGDLHFDARRPYIRVSRALRLGDDGGWLVKEPKGGKPRSVPLCAELIELLGELGQGRHPNELVFTGEDGGYLNTNSLRWTVSQAAKEAGLDKHVHPHLLRHTFASHCFQRGIPPQVVQQWLGHAHITTTERYAHLAPTTGEDLIDLLERPKAVAHGMGRKTTNTTTNTTEAQTH